MNLGVILSIVVFLILSVFLIKYREKIAKKVLKIPLPIVVLYILTSFLLIYVEEQINCKPQWCWKTFYPPTIFPIILQVFMLGVFTKILNIKNVFIPVFLFAIFGIILELKIGGLQGIGMQPLTFFMIPWVSLSYIFVSILPITILVKGRS